MTDPTIPFAHVRDRLHAANAVFTNLECCFYEPDGERSPEEEGFYAPLKEDMATLRSQADVVIASHHWGLDHEVLDYAWGPPLDTPRHPRPQAHGALCPPSLPEPVPRRENPP